MPPKTINFDPYAILNLDAGCNENQIDKAYKKSALKWHPDKNPDNKEKAQEMFLKIYQAYEFLKDIASKTTYDEAIEQKRRRSQFEEERRATSSVQRREFLVKLNQRESEHEKAGQKRKAEHRMKDNLIEQLRNEGAELLRRMKEETERKNTQSTKIINAPSSAPKHNEPFFDLEDLEKAALGDLI